MYDGRMPPIKFQKRTKDNQMAVVVVVGRMLAR
jgi:hypothetical protein